MKRKTLGKDSQIVLKLIAKLDKIKQPDEVFDLSEINSNN
jgi:hypothetical protein